MQPDISKGILSYFTRHRTLANLCLVLMLTAGVVAFPNMRAQFFPDVVVDSLSVSVSWDGAGAEDVDEAIVQVLEPALLAVQGVTGSNARSTEGRASVSLDFEPGYDIERAEKDVQQAVDAISNLPDDADEPSVRRGGWSDRVTDVVLSGPVGVDQLARFADTLSVRLFSEGVTQVSVQGVAAPSTIVEVSSLSIVQYDIGLSEIASAIGQEVNADPAGDAGDARVRTGVAKRDADAIASIVLRQNADGSSLTVGDVSSITVEGVDRDQAYFVGPNPAVQLRVDRSAQGDAIGIEETVREVVREFEAELPQGVTVELVNSRADAISGRLALLLDNGLIGLGLVVVLLFLFLSARTAFWVAAGIPVAMFAGIAIMYAFGLTLNMISLFALILTLGIVVDDAIVVGEHVDFRARRLGEPPVVAAENAAKRMFTPVFSATLTTVIAFFGLVIIGGRFGDLISDIPFTVIAILIASLVECFLILPNHLSHAMAHRAKERWYDWPSRQVNRGFSWIRETLFKPLMSFVLVMRYPMIGLAILALASQVTLFVRGDVQWRFFSAPEQGSVTGNFAMLPSATREDSLEMMQMMQKAAEDLGAQLEEEHGNNPIEFAIAQIGGNSGRGLAGADTKESYQLGAITISLIDADSRPYSSREFVTQLQQAIPMHPLAETVSFRSWGSGPGGDDIDVQIFGANADTLKAAAEALKAELSVFAEVSGAEDTLAYDKDELILELTPQGQALGFTIDDLGRTLRSRLNGVEAASYPVGARSATVRVELPADELTADFLDRTLMRASSGQYVPLADIVTVSRERGFSTIRRENGIQLISVTAGLEDDDAARATEIMDSISGDILPRLESDFGVETRMSGLSEQENEFLNDALRGLILCLVGIYLVLAWIFASWTRPIVVMAIIPFGLVGTIFGHYMWDVPMSLFTVVGLIGMVGIIINDSIVLVTTVDEYAENRGLRPAIIDAAADRLRPVFLTTATTVLGLAPLLYEGSTQAEFLKPTVITLVYGLAFGMVLVLMIVPSLLAMQEDWARAVSATRRAVGAPSRRIRGLTRLAVLWSAGVFAAIVLPVLINGQAWPVVADLLPAIGFGFGPALGAYLALVLIGLLVIYIAGAIFGRRGART
ncbi:efflux RND transporter permease subunit [Ponticoccus sp. SC2-23]|uniref:efflux RND transporter permease subunit n=1 Tax=Alexandriicola marinus TaxID=2081710 RepID=UPI00193B7835|nr:efflux RND transporter permease subunit [Alexandriicola marinus]MBM1220341.1 efflux RND transporter permease subunit [Ponticoccus sp. SC6-9]MBM1225027.1 efflux RND transporter permease subunit [Ponticoccus sp. SC6-15]MBM1228541.1 efflux RND transporter permease subunit [Ponticoccus sp. SC6-38]MBM1233822.1 efflux RND transporter permease subunit [Ponticoccus sp. SC6-45]MBM1239042.1 efflux RND transporter permease subunit [Ponticoccus sp. SC6-49]MBM1242824.1 efflux RND transporter permease s